jgi:predicted dehydrogenase
MTRPLKVAIIGTSWWADAMYLPALRNIPAADVVAVCGRDRARADAFAHRWAIPRVFTRYEELLDADVCDAVCVVTPNDTHHPITLAAIEHGLHVVCEKPLGLDYRQAAEMAAAAAASGVTTLVPYTYRYMPTTRYLKHLVDDGYLGSHYHLNLRYYSGFARGSDYLWRMDRRRAGTGVLGDLGSHFLHLAEWFFGPIATVSCRLGSLVSRTPTDPEGNSYEPADDVALITLGFRSGAHGVVHVSAVAYEDNPFGQVHEMDLHGSEGTLRHTLDWDEVQQIRGAQAGEGALREIAVPEEVWAGAPRTPVEATYRHVFRDEGRMLGEFVAAAAAGSRARPDLEDGARLQAVLDAADRSAREATSVEVDDVMATSQPLQHTGEGR